MKLPSWALLLMMTLACSNGQSPITAVLNFTNGLLGGLESNPNSQGECANDLTNAEEHVVNLTSDITSLINGDQAALYLIIADGSKLFNAIEGSSSDCDFSALVTIFQSLGTAAGQEAILGNVLGNIGTIVSDAKTLATCPQDLYTCGFNIGDIFRLVFGWEVALPVEGKALDVSVFLQGFLQGIEAPGSNAQCVTDFESLAPAVQEIVADIEQAVTGDISAVFALISAVESAIDDVEGFDGACDLSGLVGVLETLITPAGWVTLAENVAANWSTISAAAPVFLQCTTDATQCGFSAGEILRLTLGWGLGSASSIPKTVRQNNNFTIWLNSFISGLEENPSSNDVCAGDLLTLSSVFQRIYSDILSLAQGQNAALVLLIADVKTLYDDVQAFDTPCNIPALQTILQNFNFQELISNVAANAPALRADAQSVLACTTNVSLCGQSAGNFIKLILNWGI